MGELVRNSRAQSYIPFFSSCLPLKPNSEDETPSSQLPSKTRREKTNHREPSFAFLCVDLRVGQRGRGPDKRAGPSSLPAGEALMMVVMVMVVMVVMMAMMNMMMMRELLTHPITYQYGVHQNVQTDQSGHLDDDDKDDEYVDRDIITMYDNNHFSVFSTTSSFCP